MFHIDLRQLKQAGIALLETCAIAILVLAVMSDVAGDATSSHAERPGQQSLAAKSQR